LKELSLNDAGILFKLVTSIQYETGGLIAKAGNRSVKPLKQKEMEKLLNKSKDGTKVALGRLEALGIIRKEKQGRSNAYYVNDELVTFGKSAKKGDFTKVYKTKAIEIIKKLTDNEAGLLFKCMPYVHYELLMLSVNPSETDLDKVQLIRGDSLAQHIGVKHGTLNNLMSRMKHKYVIGFFDVGRNGKAYVMNPDLCDRGLISQYHQRAQVIFNKETADELITSTDKAFRIIERGETLQLNSSCM
jgi:hypothetical protein